MDSALLASKTLPYQVLPTRLFLFSLAQFSACRYVFFTQTVVFKKAMKPTFQGIGSFTYFSALMCNEVDLPRDCFTLTANTERFLVVRK